MAFLYSKPTISPFYSIKARYLKLSDSTLYYSSLCSCTSTHWIVSNFHKQIFHNFAIPSLGIFQMLAWLTHFSSLSTLPFQWSLPCPKLHTLIHSYHCLYFSSLFFYLGTHYHPMCYVINLFCLKYPPPLKSKFHEDKYFYSFVYMSSTPITDPSI